jgi:hypothetical protein
LAHEERVTQVTGSSQYLPIGCFYSLGVPLPACVFSYNS